ncbi:MAG: hypothetical protein NC238_14310 [Dehalobacter sp.]|nr:hypothetical protein [Dehalobacter sp.]
MTRLSERQARQLGIIPALGEKKKSHITRVTLQPVQWDAKTFPGGIWLQVPFVPPSLNEWKNWHWAKQGRYKKDLINAVSMLALAWRLPKFENATVQFVYYHRTNRRRDPADNYTPKFLMDALVKGGILVDDNGDLVNVPPVDMKLDPERPRTEVFVWGRT